MKKKSVVKFKGNSIILTAAALLVLATTSCKKEEPLGPANSPVNVTAVSAPATVSPSTNNSAYQARQPFSLNGVHDITISGFEINGGTATCIELANCYNIRITNCKLVNSDRLGITLTSCKNITIDKCGISNVSAGVYSFNSTNVQVRDNKIGNLTGKDQLSVTFENASMSANDARSNMATNNQ